MTISQPLSMPSLVRRSLLAALLALTAGGCVFITGDFDPLSRRPRPLTEQVVSGSGTAKILLMDLTGVISSEERAGPLGFGRRESTVSRVQAELDAAAEDDAVHAIVVRINSPGGTVTASDIIYTSLMRFKAEHRTPVLVQMLDVAASGGYYAALAADEIVASPTTVTGSIGVVFTNISFAGLMEKIGVENQTVASGAMKDIGSPLRAMTPAERAVLQALIGDLQSRFVNLVRERRPQLTPEMSTTMTDGRVFSADQALQGGLVDALGYLDDTIERAKARAGVSEARVVRYRRGDEYADTIYARNDVPAQVTQISLLNLADGGLPHGPNFLYLWEP
jgi:protease-4